MVKYAIKKEKRQYSVKRYVTQITEYTFVLKLYKKSHKSI